MHNNVFWREGASSFRVIREVEAVWVGGVSRIRGSRNWVDAGSHLPAQPAGSTPSPAASPVSVMPRAMTSARHWARHCWTQPAMPRRLRAMKSAARCFRRGFIRRVGWWRPLPLRGPSMGCWISARLSGRVRKRCLRTGLRAKSSTPRKRQSSAIGSRDAACSSRARDAQLFHKAHRATPRPEQRSGTEGGCRCRLVSHAHRCHHRSPLHNEARNKLRSWVAQIRSKFLIKLKKPQNCPAALDATLRRYSRALQSNRR